MNVLEKVGEGLGQRFFGFDDQGELFCYGDVLFRRINDNCKADVARIHRVFSDNNFVNKGFIETRLREDGNLEHRKLVTSYPYEWSVNMYKDAVLLHLELFNDLDKYELTLKDALPQNIVFDYSKPVFVDFLSLVSKKNIQSLAWLDSRGYSDARFAVVKTMLIPYLIVPLVLMAAGRNSVARELLSIRACNCGGKPPAWLELMKPAHHVRGWISRYLQSIKFAAAIFSVTVFIKKMNANAFVHVIKTLINRVRVLNVTPHSNASMGVDEEEFEAILIGDLSAIRPIQKTIYELLLIRAKDSVLTLGEKSSLYATIAAINGASVIAIQDDEASTDILYNHAKKYGLRILPLIIPLGALTQEIHGSGGELLFRAAIERLGADLVLAFGVIHRLVLHDGCTIEDIFAIFSQLANKTLILEFVSIDDDDIRNNPEFFYNPKKFDASSYNVNLVINAGLCHFSHFESITTDSDKRIILVFDR